MLQNRVRALRKVNGMSQAELAQRVGVSRQTIRSIEAGSVVPSTLIALRMSRAFDVPVEDIFQEQSDLGVDFVVAGDKELEPGERVILTEIDGRRVAHVARFGFGQQMPTAPNVHIAERRADGHGVELTCFRRGEYRPWNVVAGCDPALALFADHASSRIAAASVYWLNVDNARASKLLADGQIHAAAIHAAAIDLRQPWASSELVNDCTRVRIASWQLGWVVKRGNPLGFSGPEDLEGGRFRIVNRPIGAGARALLDRELKTAEVDASTVPQYTWTVDGHMQVAMAIEAGAADVGIAIAGAASTMHLDFIPIREEHCDLWIPKRYFQEESVERMVDTLSSDVFRWDLARFGPYDVERTGDIDAPLE